jgi:O-antigen ligase
VREGGLNQRILIWQTGWEEFRKHPFLGVGASAFASTMERQIGRPEGGERVAHNAFLSVLFESGVVGLFIYVSLLLAMVLVVFQMPRLERNFWLVTLLAWGIGVCSLTWEYRKPTWFLFAMLTVQAATRVADRQVLVRQGAPSVPRRSAPLWQWRPGFLSR